MNLTVVGCAGSFPTAGSPASCYLVEHDGARIVVDLGNGAFGALQHYVDTSLADALAGIALSHCHLDHCADVGSLFTQRRYHPHREFAPLPLVGPTEAPRRLADIYGTSVDALADVLVCTTFAEQPMTLGPFTIETVRAAHPVEAYSIRISAGGSVLVYSGDTGPSVELDRLAEGCDVALFEASNIGTDNAADLHMTGADAARSASVAGAGLLVLTHLVEWNDPNHVRDEAAEFFDGPIELARPGLTISL